MNEAGRGERAGEGVDDGTGGTDEDRTVAVVRPVAAPDEDRTVAVVRSARAGDTDPTVVARPLADDDLTVVVPRGAWRPGAGPSSAGQPDAAPANAAPAARPSAPLDTTQPMGGAESVDRTEPTDRAERRIPPALHERDAPALDPQRRIAPVPGAAPWEHGPAAVPGLHQGLPVPYVPRSAWPASAGTGPDEVQRRVGPPPEPRPVVARPGRESLPSLERRERRARRLTLIAYPLVVAASLAGLVLLAQLAFG